jgi:hypothetical protein
MRDDEIDLASFAALEKGFEIGDAHWSAGGRVFYAVCDGWGADVEFGVFLCQGLHPFFVCCHGAANVLHASPTASTKELVTLISLKDMCQSPTRTDLAH